MKTKLKIAVFAAIAAAGCIAGISKSRTAEISAITLANVDALSTGEDNFDECKDGCSTSNSGDYCCTLFGKSLYYPRK